MNNSPYTVKDDLVIGKMLCKLDSLLAKRKKTSTAIAKDLDKAKKVLEVAKNGGSFGIRVY